MTPSWRILYQEENARVTLRNLRVLCLIAMTLVPAASLLDFFAYPKFWASFLTARLVAAAVEVVLMLVTYTPFGRNHYRWLMLIVPMVPMLTIAWMIHHTGDPSSSYYAGLSLCLVGVGYLFQWSCAESLVAVCLTIAIYLCATVPLIRDFGLDSEDFGQFVNNGIFLVLNSVIIVTGTLVHQRIREREMEGRYNLAESRRELEEKNLQLVEMDRMKTDFFSNVTHELRTPLTLMIAPLQKLQRLYTGEEAGGSPLGAELGGIYHNALRLLKLINNLLDLSSADAGRLVVVNEEFSLRDTTKRLAQSVGKMAAHGGVTTALDYKMTLDRVTGDAEKVEKILLNLLFNAVKFTPAGGLVKFGITKAEEHVVFTVEDTGVGISEHHLPFVFDRFWQADSSVTRNHPGTGLGLAIVKELVEHLGGSIQASSQLGRGTTMHVRLPVREVNGVFKLGLTVPVSQALEDNPGATGNVPATETSEPGAGDTGEAKTSSSASWIKSVYREAEQQPDESSLLNETASSPLANAEENSDFTATRPLILIADDDPGMLRFLSAELSKDYRILQAADGEQALELAISRRPDLVISDYMMPEVDGLTLCRELRSQLESKLVPVMLVTARSDEEVRMTALRNGANDILVKPFSLTEFHARVSNLVQSSLLQKEIGRRNAELERAMSELRSTQRELALAEKMASLGVLTAGIMHEINNPLNFARSALYVMDRRAGKLPETARDGIKDVVSDLGESISRISTIISDLRTFCHPGTDSAACCRISEPLHAALRILAAPLKDGRIHLLADIADDLTVRGDQNQIALVLINIIKNAVDALGAKQFGEGEAPLIRVSAHASGEMVEILVSDNGPGLSRENLAHIFDPFFTTKAPGEGTGLGLSICYRIVTALRGSIAAEGELSQGLRFTIRLPQVVSRVEAGPVLPS